MVVVHTITTWSERMSLYSTTLKSLDRQRYKRKLCCLYGAKSDKDSWRELDPYQFNSKLWTDDASHWESVNTGLD